MTTVSSEISRNVWTLAGQITAADPGKTPPHTLPASPAGLSPMRKWFRALRLVGGVGAVIAVFNGVVGSPLAEKLAKIQGPEAPDGSSLQALQTWLDQWPLGLLAVVLLVLFAGYRWEPAISFRFPWKRGPCLVVLGIAVMLIPAVPYLIVCPDQSIYPVLTFLGFLYWMVAAGIYVGGGSERYSSA